MGAVTLRNLSHNVVKIIRQRAAERKTSINKVVASMLEDGLGLSGGPREPVIHHDLDHLFGSWSRKEADVFDRELTRQRTIEPEIWK